MHRSPHQPRQKAHSGLFFALAGLITLLWPQWGQSSQVTQANTHDQPPNITDQLVDLGNKPQQAGMRGSALNIWDMVEYQGKVFIGMGNTTTNAGPIPVWAYDHGNKTWDITQETIIDQEAIERFRLIDGDLYIPSADPKGRATDKSKFYRRDPSGTWTHYSSLNALTAHIRDLAVIDGWLVGVGNSRTPHRLVEGETGTVKVPLEDVQRFSGGQWPLATFASAITTQPSLEASAEGMIDVATTQRNRIANWFFSTFELHEGWHASTRWMGWAPIDPAPDGLNLPPMDFPPNVPPFPHLVKWDTERHEWIAPIPTGLDRLIPECPTCDQNLVLYPHKPLLFGELWWGPIKSYGLMPQTYQSAYNQSVGMVVKPRGQSGRLISLPDPHAIAEAVTVMDQRLILLANTPLAAHPDSGTDKAQALPPTGYRVWVYALGLSAATETSLDETDGIDPHLWTPVLTFESPNPVRSFVRVGTQWYFGLGVNSGEPVRQAGSLWTWSDPTPNTPPP